MIPVFLAIILKKETLSSIQSFCNKKIFIFIFVDLQWHTIWELPELKYWSKCHLETKHPTVYHKFLCFEVCSKSIADVNDCIATKTTVVLEIPPYDPKKEEKVVSTVTVTIPKVMCEVCHCLFPSTTELRKHEKRAFKLPLKDLLKVL